MCEGLDKLRTLGASAPGLMFQHSLIPYAACAGVGDGAPGGVWGPYGDF